MYPLLQWSTSYPTTSPSTTTLFCFYHQRFVSELIHQTANSSRSSLKSNVRWKHSFGHARRNLKLQWKKKWRWEFKVEKIHRDQVEFLVVKGEIQDAEEERRETSTSSTGSCNCYIYSFSPVLKITAVNWSGSGSRRPTQATSGKVWTDSRE